MDRTFLKTGLFLMPVILPITLIGGIFGLIGMIIGLIVSFIICILIIRNLDRLIIRIYKARPVRPGELTELRQKAMLFSQRAGVPAPSIYITEMVLPGSFVVGRKIDKTVLVMPRRLLSMLKNEEFCALLASNIVQINDSIGLRTLAALISGIFLMIASAIRWGAVFTGFGDYNDPAPRLFWQFVMGLVSPPSAAMIHSVAMDEIDTRAAKLCKNPSAIISAVERLETNNVTGYANLGFLCLVDPKTDSFFEVLFRSHKSKENRFKNLKQEGHQS
ncbi:Protease HtpX [uncultured archaeon]|nr:Protease HtpX [uncultured archaeon]